MEGTAIATLNTGMIQAPNVDLNEKEFKPASGVDSDLETSQAPSLKEAPGTGSDDARETTNHLQPTATNRTTGTTDSVIAYPEGFKLAAILIALALAVLCVALDNTIIATAIPKITDAFDSLDDVGWFASAYLLTTCSFQLFFGRLYSLYNVKWVFLVALGIFELGSIVCGAAPSAVALIVGRAIAGLGGAGLFSGALIILANAAPLEKRPTYAGMLLAPSITFVLD